MKRRIITVVLLLLLLAPLQGAHAAARLLTTPTLGPASVSTRFARPVLAFYYTWYHPSTWCSCTMSDLPRDRYESGDVATVDRQIAQAVSAGITGFITSWPGPGNTQDANLRLLLQRAAAYQRATGTRFVSSVYFESDADAIRGNLVGAMRYLIDQYVTDPHFFRWHNKPVIFIWDPLGNGRTLATWASLRRQVDPQHRSIWSAEGTDPNLLSVFDGLHLYSAAYWGLLDGTINSVDRSFRTRVDAFARAHHTAKIWAAGVEPGYDDTRVPGRTRTYRVPRRNGTTYRSSWSAAIASNPDWITITSWNEWLEGAMIEPSRTYGTLYLTLTRRFARQWRNG